MKGKLRFAIIYLVGTLPGYAVASEVAKLTQAEYDHQIQQYTDQVNATKAVLDDPDSHADTVEQRKAFCARLEAYQSILKISQQNNQLENANMMLMIANRFLTQQQESLADSGMNSSAFCGSKAN